MKFPILHSLSIIFSSLFFSCNNSSTGPNAENTSFTIVKDTEEKVDSLSRVNKDSQEFPNEVMKQSEILFNGKLSKYFSYSDFKKHFGLADSTKKLIDVDPCTYIFQSEEQPTNDNQFLYKDGSTFESYKQEIGIEVFCFRKSNFITYQGIRIDSTTTLDEMEKLFPVAVKNILPSPYSDQPHMQFIQLNEEFPSDGLIEFYFKNKRAYSIHWWFPC
ncbi:MAG: hypothetical protein RL204_402 [Bacteroidota bacterium]